MDLVKNKYFTSDGIRGVYGKEITDKTAYIFGYALCQLLNKPTVIIGRDTRKSGIKLTNAFIGAVNECGGKILDFGIAPTPAIAYLVQKEKADFGVVFTASHNPPEFNGIKVFSSCNCKIDYKLEQILDHFMIKNEYLDYIPSKNLTYNVKNLVDYENFLVNSCGLSLCGKKIVLDCANGATQEIAPKVFSRLGAEIIVLGNKKKGNINSRCGCLHMENLVKNILKTGADFGFSFDGDGDRILAADKKGRIVDGDGIILSLIRYYHFKRRKNKKIVITVQSNLGLIREIEKLGYKCFITNVGDRYVIRKMQEIKSSHGGEQSGHIIIGDKSQTGDGILVAVILSYLISKTGKSLSELCNFEKNFQSSKSFKCKNKDVIVKDPHLIKNIEKCGRILKNGRILFRASETEPKVRLMVESENKKNCLFVFKKLEAIISDLIQI